jgi:hypothetical protein
MKKISIYFRILSIFLFISIFSIESDASVRRLKIEKRKKPLRFPDSSNRTPPSVANAA